MNDNNAVKGSSNPVTAFSLFKSVICRVKFAGVVVAFKCVLEGMHIYGTFTAHFSVWFLIRCGGIIFLKWGSKCRIVEWQRQRALTPLTPVQIRLRQFLFFGGDSMVSEIIVAGFSLIGTFIGSFSGMKLMSYRIEQLEKKVERHNNFAERVPILEEQMKVANHRITDLETHEYEREVNGA